MALSKPKDPTPMDIPPHNIYDILPTPSIPPIYSLVPPPKSYKGKYLASSISQPIRIYFVPPATREEKSACPLILNIFKPLVGTLIFGKIQSSLRIPSSHFLNPVHIVSP